MTASEFLPNLNAVRARGLGKWSARCPGHADQSPSLTVAEGDRGLLLKCWAGCSLKEITVAMGLSIHDLFYDVPSDDSQRRETARRRAQERATREAAYQAAGRRMDALRQAEYLVSSARRISIDRWSHQQLDAALDRLAEAYALLESEAA